MEEFGFPFLVGLVGLSIDLSISACFLKKNFLHCYGLHGLFIHVIIVE